MAVDMTKLTPSQLQIVERIINAGRTLGVPNELIHVAINIANAESSLNPNPPANPKTTAKGIFQYIDATWKREWMTHVKNHPDSALINITDSRTNIDAQIAIMFQELIRWHDEYDKGRLARNYLPSGNLHHQVLQLKKRGIDITKNFLYYAYFRHNTSVRETTTVINRDFTANNLAFIQLLVNQSNSN